MKWNMFSGEGGARAVRVLVQEDRSLVRDT